MGFLRLFSKRSGNKSKVDVSPKSLDYEAMVAGAPPVLGTNPARGNGPLQIKILPRDVSDAQIAVKADGLVADGFPMPSPVTPSFRAEDIERPSSAPNGFRTLSRSLVAGGSLRVTRGAKSLLKRPPPLSFRVPRPETSPRPRSISQNGIDTIVFAQPQVALSVHSRSNSIVSNTGSRYRDIIEAHSEIKPINFKIRMKATGIRNYGEDVAERNLGENGHNLDSPSVKAFYARSSMISEKSKMDEITKQLESEPNSRRARAPAVALNPPIDLATNSTISQTSPRATTSYEPNSSSYAHPDRTLSLGVRLPVNCNLQHSRSVNPFLPVESNNSTSVPRTAATTEQDTEVHDHPPVIEWPLRTIAASTLKPSAGDATLSLTLPQIIKHTPSSPIEEKSAPRGHSPLSNASSVKCFAVNPKYHHERSWSSSSSTVSISDMRSNPSSPSRSQHTADTSVNLSQTSFKSATPLPSLTFLPIPEAPDNFNIDDYISTDASSIKGHQRHTGESEEELLFNDFGYGAHGTQLPGLLDSSTLFKREASPVPVQSQHCRCSSWTTTPINAGSFGRAVGQQRYVLDTGVEDDTDETDYEDSSRLRSPIPLHSPKPQHHHALSGDIYHGVVGHVPRTRTFGSDGTFSLQGSRGTKRTPVVLNCRGIQSSEMASANNDTRPITPVSPRNQSKDTTEIKTPENTHREKGKQKMQAAEDENKEQQNDTSNKKSLPPSTPDATVTAAMKRRKQIKAGKRATEQVKKRRPPGQGQGVISSPKSPKSPSKSPRMASKRLTQRTTSMGVGGGECSDEEHHADAEG
ncbi:hypothetical protein QR685DRAFT_229567 [Neurospora intermedia]|uniref:Uncharacterized protein n=1 Tax=Neurospora intermedia TaxID=5142 RepID=A0ABR3DHU7_NEUIN